MREYHNLYVQTDTFLLANVFENCRNKCIKTFGLDPLNIVSARQACLKETCIELELLTNIDTLLMAEE